MVWNVIEVLALLAVVAGAFLVAGIGPALIVAGALAIAASWFVNRKGGDSE